MSGDGWHALDPQVLQLVALGLQNDEIAARIKCPPEVIAEWRKRFYEQCLVGLDGPRP